ncbi:MAG: terminase small subunit [Pelagibacterales bacterium]|nr:terminase small subunit [Pelagibacterales bacterium]
MKKADLEKEEKFVEHYINTGNAKESALASGYNSKSACSMGHYLKKKFALEIEERQKEKLQGMSGKSLGVLDRLLNADSDNVKLNACKLILECNGFTKDSNVNVNVRSEYSTKTDDELIEMLLSLKPELKEKFN